MIVIAAEWIIINGDKTKYKIFSNGDVLNTKRNKKIKHMINEYGYHQVILSHNGIKYVYQVHRLVAIYFLKYIPGQECNQVNHKDGNKDNNDVSNLEWVTPSYNQIHAFATGLQSRTRNKLNYYDRLEIYNLLMNSNISLNKIAKLFNTSTTNIYNIYKKHTYVNETYNMVFRTRDSNKYNDESNNPNCKYDINTVEKICELLKNSNLTHKEISIKLNVNTQTVSNIASKRNWVNVSNKYGLPKNTKPFDKITISKIISMIKLNMQTKDIIKELNLDKTNSTYNCISYYRRKYGNM